MFLCSVQEHGTWSNTKWKYKKKSMLKKKTGKYGRLVCSWQVRSPCRTKAHAVMSTYLRVLSTAYNLMFLQKNMRTLETAHAHLKLHLDNLADSEILLVSVSQYCRSSLMWQFKLPPLLPCSSVCNLVDFLCHQTYTHFF